MIDIIKNSSLYKSFKDEEELKEKVSKKYIIDKIEINKLDDLTNLLHICQFWKIDELPWEIYDFIYKNQKSEKLKLEDYSEIQDTFTDYNKLSDIQVLLTIYADKIPTTYINYRIPITINYDYNIEILFKTIIKNKKLNLLKWCNTKYIFSDRIMLPYCEWVVLYNYPECLQYLIDNNYSIINNNCLVKAIENNNLECLKILHINKIKWSDTHIKLGIEHKSKECVEFLQNNKCLYEEEHFKEQEETKMWCINYGHLSFS